MKELHNLFVLLKLFSLYFFFMRSKLLSSSSNSIGVNVDDDSSVLPVTDYDLTWHYTSIKSQRYFFSFFFYFSFHFSFKRKIDSVADLIER